MKRILILLILISNSIFAISQNYPKNYFRGPLGGKLLMSSNFCELRSNHFHGGLDLRTGSNGKPIYAPADGYVSRIKVKSGGYGNGIYLTHYEGYKTVYGHLQNYSNEIKKWVFEKQYEIQEFELDVYLDSTAFPVKKGQVIGYSGNSGYSFGPHLHFETRNMEDEPINPQLFGFNIPDAIAPEIRTIAIYPATDESYVNYKHNSKTISVGGSNISETTTVHGGIYFGIEAYDRVSDVNSKNTIYSVKLLVDGELIFHTAYDKFSYDNGRDINSMIDYRRRKTTNMRLQRTLVEPNNELLHYRKVENNGIVEFYDDKIHTLQYIVSDIDGNTDKVTFKVKSTSKNIDFGIERDSTTLMKYDEINTFKKPGIKISFPEKTLFDNIFFDYQTIAGNIYSPMYKLHDEFVPLKDYYTLSLSTASVPKNLKDKAVILRRDFEGDNECYLGVWKNDYLSVEVREFGLFYIDVDTRPPTIRPKNISNGKNMSNYSSIQIEVIDNMSGISDWTGFVDGEWVLVSFDKKNDMFYYRFDDKTKSGKNNFKFIVTDGVGNTATYEIDFYR